MDGEKSSLIQLRHELEGMKIAVESIDSVISSIKSAVNPNDATVKLIELGIDELQAKAILRMNITSLVYESSTIQSRITQCNEWIKVSENT